MVEAMSDSDLADALQECADEPVHIPGVIQPCGVLFAYGAEDGKVSHVSENADAFLGRRAEDILGQSVRDLFGGELWHALRNAIARPGRSRIGRFDLGQGPLEAHVFQSGPHVVVEAEPPGDMLPSPTTMQDLSQLVGAVRATESEQDLFDLTVRLMRTVTGYGRVMVYRFDRDWNGEIVAEARKTTLEPMLHLRFPHWDIPRQARAIMAKIDLRCITDVHQTPVAIVPATPALDITPAFLRGVSPVHLVYLQNMESAATMTLSIVVEGALWGMISFHHGRPRIPDMNQRDLLTSFLPIFQMKLGLLREQRALRLAERIDAMQADIEQLGEDGGAFERTLDNVAGIISHGLAIDGLALFDGTEATTSGMVPGPTVVDLLMRRAGDAGEPVFVESFAEEFPELASEFNGCAGALIAPYPENRAICAFRVDKTSQIKWAGNPEKHIERHEGRSRLQPRGSFSVYLGETSGHCEPWTSEDLLSLKRLWPLLSSAERRSFIARMNRQQQLMIDELNHRVRNILALVKSVSRQARRRYGSLESYSKALESRIHALAEAHNIGTGAAVEAVSVRHILEIEASPYTDQHTNRFTISGQDHTIHAHAAPIFALVIHELMTNAAKYGAWSVEDGRIAITLEPAAGGLRLQWQEDGGPPVVEPMERGFGTLLIEQAVPYELGGRSHLRFAPDGVQAELTFPATPFDIDEATSPGAPRAPLVVDTVSPEDLPEGTLAGSVLVLEDNYIIAEEMREEMLRLGATDVETLTSVAAAMEFLEDGAPVFALLDINLGAGETSEEVAAALTARNIPFVFVSGYGERAPMPALYDHVPRLPKPLETRALVKAIHSLKQS